MAKCSVGGKGSEKETTNPRQKKPRIIEEEDEGNNPLSVFLTDLEVLDSEKETTNSRQKKPKIIEEEDEESSISVFLTNLEVLECFICYELLSFPVFHCKNGHTACNSCCIMVGNKCPMCSKHIGNMRNLAIEKVLESLSVSCPNAKYGCKEIVNYIKRNEHQKACIYAPCSCPHSECGFVSSSKEVSLHFSSKHKDSAIIFKYNNYFSVSLNVKDKVIVLLEQKGGLFILNNNTVEHSGNVLNLCCIGPNSPEKGLCYNVIAKYSDGRCLALRSFMDNSQWPIANNNTPSTSSLVIPSDFFDSSGFGQLELKISSSQCSSSLVVL